MRPVIVLLVQLLLFPLVGRGQEADTLAVTADRGFFMEDSDNPLRFDNRRIVSRVHPPDSADVASYAKKHFWRAAGETVGFNIGLWAFDRYVVNGHYAHISWNTIVENFKHGFEWDNDHLHTNMFDHPYNGSLFFNAGRANGYNFWQSELFAIAGSAMWEMFMGSEYPSTNDIIATPIGGAAIGEVLYRTSDMILDDRSTGGERLGREVAAFIVDPMRGLNRIFTGDAWRRRTTPGRQYGIPPLSLNVSLGGRLLTMSNDNNDARVGPVAEVDVEYGDRYAEQTFAPYDWFSFFIELQMMKTQPLLSRVEIVGRLLSKEVVNRRNLNVSVGLYQHFDYFDSDTIKHIELTNDIWSGIVPYKLGTPASFGAGAMARFQPLDWLVAEGSFYFNGVLLGGILTDFYRDYHRNYNWGSGYDIKAGLSLSMFGDRIRLDLRNQFYKLFTWQGYDPDYDWSLTPDGTPVDVQGDASTSSFDHFELRFGYRLWRSLYLTGELDLYRRITRYDYKREGWLAYPTVDSSQLGFQLMLSYEF